MRNQGSFTCSYIFLTIPGLLILSSLIYCYSVAFAEEADIVTKLKSSSEINRNGLIVIDFDNKEYIVSCFCFPPKSQTPEEKINARQKSEFLTINESMKFSIGSDIYVDEQIKIIKIVTSTSEDGKEQMSRSSVAKEKITQIREKLKGVFYDYKNLISWKDGAEYCSAISKNIE